jgi:type I restriction enzyme S subunit
MKNHYQIKRLGDICDIVGGGTPSKSNGDFYGGQIPWATVRDMKSDDISDTEFRITEEAVRQSSTNVIPKNNVVIASRVGLGKVCLLKNDTAINQDLRAILPKKKDGLYIRYLFWWLKSMADDIEKAGTGATVKGVTLPFLKGLEISVPEVGEQRRIAKVLDEVFEGIGKAKEIAEKNLRNSRELFDSYLQDVFENGSDKWKEKTIAELGPVQTGTTPKTSEKENYGDFIPFIKPSDFLYDNSLSYHNQGLSEIGLKRGRLIKEFSVLMVCIGTVGKVSYSDRDVSCNQQINAVTLRSLDEAKFFCYQMRTKKFQSIVLRNAPKATLPIINKSKWQGLAVMVPPLSEQKTIVKKLDALAEETRKLEAIYRQKLANLEELKKSVLKAAFTPNSGFGKEENIDFAHSSQTVG